MIIKFLGVRGSLPTPITSEQIQSKISAVVQRITAVDVKTQDTRERFLASLPKWLFGTIGGNTACVQLKGKDGTCVILDAGSGLRSLSSGEETPNCDHYNLLFSHFHWDHIQGLPFFAPIFDGKTTFDCYSTNPDARDLLAKQMKSPYFPVDFDVVDKRMAFHTVKAGEAFQVGEFDVHCCEMKHPGGSTAYSFEEKGDIGKENKKFVFATDVELSNTEKSPQYTPLEDSENASSSGAEQVQSSVFENASCIVLDSQYTVSEAYKKGGWGHSAFCYAVDFAAKWNIKSLYLFHHEPSYDDKKLHNILDTARWYAKYIEHSNIDVHLAREGCKVQI